MRTRSSSNLPIESPPNPSTSNPKRHNCRHSNQPFVLEESPVDTMADQSTMAELLRAPTEGYAEAIVVPPILAEQFELKHSLINMMTSNQFFGLEKENPHDHIRWFNKITSTIKYKDVPNSSIKLMLFSFSLAGCLVADGNTFSELRDNILGYVAAAAVNYNQGNFGYRPSGSRSLPSNTIANPKGELKAITTQSGIVLDGPSVLIPPPFINLEEDERVEETLTDQDLVEYTIKLPPPLVQKPKPHSQRNFFVHQRDPLHPNIPYPSRILKQNQQEKDEKMLKALLSNKEKLLELENTPFNENCSAVILKKLPEKLRDPGKFLIPCGFSELKCKALADLDDVFYPKGGNVIKSLNDDPTLDYVLKPLFPFLILVEDSDSFLEKSDTSLSYSDISLPEFETFIYHTEETNSGSTTTHADYSLLKYDSLLFEIEPDHGELTSVVIKDNLA
nr:reverse transcriptase domain-containing protein [Tanacetum cinerariifolium]